MLFQVVRADYDRKMWGCWFEVFKDAVEGCCRVFREPCCRVLRGDCARVHFAVKYARVYRVEGLEFVSLAALLLGLNTYQKKTAFTQKLNKGCTSCCQLPAKASLEAHVPCSANTRAVINHRVLQYRDQMYTKQMTVWRRSRTHGKPSVSRNT